MDNSKAVNYVSVNNLDIEIEEVCRAQDNIFVNDDLILILNGTLQQLPIINVNETFQIAEPRIILVMEGSGEVCINLQDYHIKKGHVILVPGDSIVEVNEISDDAQVAAIVVRDNINIPEEIIHQPSPTDYDRLLRMFLLLWDIVKISPYRRKTVHNILKTIVSDIQEIKESEVENFAREGLNRTKELFLQFKRLVYKNCKQERSIPFYAAQLHITPHHLSAIIKKASTRSVMYWINRATVQETKLLLKYNGMMAYEVADHMNFPSASTFSKFFKRETGMTPLAYQNTTKR